MIILGLVLLIIGFVTGIAILWTIGVIVLVVGPWFGDNISTPCLGVISDSAIEGLPVSLDAPE